MLKEIYESQSLTYDSVTLEEWTYDDENWGNPVSPYIENLWNCCGLAVVREGTVDSLDSILFVGLFTHSRAGILNYRFSWHRFNNITGEYIERRNFFAGVFAWIGGIIQSRSKALWWNQSGTWVSQLVQIIYEAPNTLGDHVLTASEFGKGFWRIPAYDDVIGFVMDADEDDSSVLSTWTTGPYFRGTKTWSLHMPGVIVGIALEDEKRAYVLCANRVLVLVDYVDNKVLGAVRMPSDIIGNIASSSDVSICWDGLLRRLLYIEKVPNNEDGSCAMVIKGYRMNPLPVRLTTPIPLEVPRKNRIIKVTSQLVGDMNEGVSGGIISAEVTNNGSLVGFPITDVHGRATIKVLCEGDGSVDVACSTEQPGY